MATFSIITGLQGAGKTMKGVELILKYLEEGAVIHTNIPLLWDRFHDDWPDHQLVKLPDDPNTWVRSGDPAKGEPLLVSDIIIGGREGGGENLVIVDETAIDFGTDDQQAKSEKKRLEPIFRLVALLRHVGLDIYFIAQDSADVNAKLRRLASFRIHCINNRKVPAYGWFLAPLFGDFKRVVYGKTDKKPLPGSTTHHNFNPAIAQLYKTHGMRDRVAMTVSPTREGKSEEIASVGRGRVLAIIGAVVALVVAAIVALYYLISPMFSGPSQVATSAPSFPPSASPLSPLSPAPSGSAPPAPGSAPSAPPRGGLVAVEWDPWDEFIITSVTHYKTGPRLSTRNGPVLHVGASYMGERIDSMVEHRGWFYFIGEQGRVVVARPIHHHEREQLRQESVLASAQTSKKDEQDTSSKPDAEAPGPMNFLGKLATPPTKDTP